ncbi:apolipoprotein N-acyltransferase [Halarcobacter ebronensis]|uniref:Apolipoprotein N-acyltransferase n=2 Tax=Halarcobacter ebronensis TaxID=1462615 RepID=A0A4Q1ALV1_9BACT|nr:apolipoprotein N-acyltransferase [Halarcobacter ebronensis]RXK06371.1 apolipoprotein N-acyltransferase [Halarcobacter ebronensis]
MFLVKRDNFNKTYIIKGLMIALFFSAFIYLAHFNLESKLFNTILGLLGIYFVLISKKQTLFFTGFFIGLFWFYWVGNSFVYYDLAYLKPIVPFAFALVYGFLFFLISIVEFTFYKAAILFIFSYIHPFGFNWFVPDLVFINSYFKADKPSFAIVLISLFLFINFKTKWKVFALLPLLYIYTNSGEYIDNPKLKISMPQINVNQDRKWAKDNLSNVIDENFRLIEEAIKEKKDLIILPETAFPIVLNKDEFVLTRLFELSKHINIVVGALYYEDNNYYNTTYYFNKMKAKIAKKVVLVPFGEKIPLPKFMVDFINNTFYNGAQDYKEAKTPTDFEINGIKFRNAICYEATSETLFKNLDGIKYMIATSNNAWFTPSIEPTLQNLLLKYYAKRYDITILHSVNGSENGIIRP